MMVLCHATPEEVDTTALLGAEEGGSSRFGDATPRHAIAGSPDVPAPLTCASHPRGRTINDDDSYRHSYR
ncbi:MAG: hypothetical protein U5L04_07395 [Trueperaceae bacterium]|nr:hypothetical protein [Trueperaceae bacterium]